MATVKAVNTLKINKLSKDKYNQLLAEGNADTDALYLIPYTATPAFSKIVTDQGTIEATEEGDTLTFADSDSVTISAEDKKITFSAVSASTDYLGVVELTDTVDATDNKAVTPAGVSKRLYDSANGIQVTLKNKINNEVNILNSSTTESSETSIEFIDSVTQVDGKISATKKSIPTATTSSYGITTLTNDIDNTEEKAITPSEVKAFAEHLSHQTYYNIMRDMVTAWGDEGGKIVVIPEGTSEIATNQYKDNTTITTVVIPESVTSIGASAFNGCTNLTSIWIPDSGVEVKNLAFLGCSGVESITIGANATLITSSSFETDNLKSIKIGKNVRAITSAPFSECPIEYAEIPAEWAGSINNAHLKTLVITSGDISAAAFKDCSTLTSVSILEGVTSIGQTAFSGCSNLTSVVIPDSVTSIGSSAFYGCSNLTSITYCGTEEEWNAITKGTNWDYNTGSYTITYTGN